MKTFSDLRNEVYEPKSADEKRFKDKHVAVKKRVGIMPPDEEDNLFQATKINPIDRKGERHGYDSAEAEKVYEEEGLEENRTHMAILRHMMHGTKKKRKKKASGATAKKRSPRRKHVKEESMNEGTKDNIFEKRPRRTPSMNDIVHNGKVVGSWWKKGGEFHGEHSGTGMSWAADTKKDIIDRITDHHDEVVASKKKKPVQESGVDSLMARLGLSESSSTHDYSHETDSKFSKIAKDVAEKDKKKGKRGLHPKNYTEETITEDHRKICQKHMRSIIAHSDTIKNAMQKMLAKDMTHYDAKFTARQLEDIADNLKGMANPPSATVKGPY